MSEARLLVALAPLGCGHSITEVSACMRCLHARCCMHRCGHASRGCMHGMMHARQRARGKHACWCSSFHVWAAWPADSWDLTNSVCGAPRMVRLGSCRFAVRGPQVLEDALTLDWRLLSDTNHQVPLGASGPGGCMCYAAAFSRCASRRPCLLVHQRPTSFAVRLPSCSRNATVRQWVFSSCSVRCQGSGSRHWHPLMQSDTHPAHHRNRLPELTGTNRFA